VLSIEDVSAGYGKFQVLKAVSMKVETGQTVVILGPNGGGKSTLLNLIVGLLRPTSGTINFDGQRIDGKEAHEIVEKGISIVLEGGRLFPRLTVYDNLKIGTFTKRSRKEFRGRTEQIFLLFPILKRRQNQISGSLSGGERQMLAIARALMNNPKLIIMDEPSAGLAPLVVNHVFEFIKGIKSEGYSILISEQNAKKSLELADYAYLLESGKIQFQGTKEHFLGSPDIKKTYLGI